MRIDLIWLDSAGRPAPEWNLGEVWPSLPDPASLAAAVTRLDAKAGFILFWDSELGWPDEPVVRQLALGSGDVWHCGIRLGMSLLPQCINYVDPVWRFNRDPAPDEPGTSWRMSLRACLVRKAVLERLGGPDPHFETLASASLELGHRWIRHGAMMRNVPDLAPLAKGTPPDIPLHDEARFLRLRYGRMWLFWAGFRMWRHGTPLKQITDALRLPAPPGVYHNRSLHDLHHAPSLTPVSGEISTGAEETSFIIRESDQPFSVSVLIPTLDRYVHLFTLLDQLRLQTTQPEEIIVIDQTDPSRRDTKWPQQFADLPLRVIWRERPGQCSSRNAGLLAVSGQTVLFLDDDDEIPPDLIEQHLQYMNRFGVDASCGVAEEVGAGSLPADFTLIRDSDVFPTNNSLLRTTALAKSGLFDLAYERGERADGDLGMRLYLSGATLGLNPGAAVLHLHAPRGGLRRHNARVVTRSGSRASLWQRHLLASTEGYYWCRYFTDEQVNEALLIRTMSTLRGHAGGLRRLARIGVMLILLPDTWRQNRRRLAEGRALLFDFPSIPSYHPSSAVEHISI